MFRLTFQRSKSSESIRVYRTVDLCSYLRYMGTRDPRHRDLEGELAAVSKEPKHLRSLVVLRTMLRTARTRFDAGVFVR